MKIIKEACVGKLEQAKMAEYYKADRVEICSRLDLDGLTPDRPTIESNNQLIVNSGGGNDPSQK